MKTLVIAIVAAAFALSTPAFAKGGHGGKGKPPAHVVKK